MWWINLQVTCVCFCIFSTRLWVLKQTAVRKINLTHAANLFCLLSVCRVLSSMNMSVLSAWSSDRAFYSPVINWWWAAWLQANFLVVLILKTTKIAFFYCQFLKLINVCGSAVNKCGASSLGGEKVQPLSSTGLESSVQTMRYSVIYSAKQFFFIPCFVNYSCSECFSCSSCWKWKCVVLPKSYTHV